MIKFHDSITLSEVRRVAEYLDCRLVQDRRGNIVITPRSLPRAPVFELFPGVNDALNKLTITGPEVA